MTHHAEPNKHGPRLSLGKVVITDAASTAIETAQVEGVLLLTRHLHGDWGDVIKQDALQNELAVLLGLRVQSRYVLTDGAVIWIETDADRTATAIMLADCHQEKFKEV